MKKQWPWAVAVAALLMLCIWNLYRNYRLQATLSYLTGGKGLISRSHPFKEAVVAARDLEFQHAGRFLKWPESLEVMGAEGDSHTYRGYRLVLAFSELSCNSCRDEQTRFVQDLTHGSGAPVTAIVIHARTPRYVRSYMRLNQIRQPLLYDRAGAFFEQNRIGETPMLFLINERDEVIAAHYPVDGEPALSQPFQRLCYRSFGLDPPDPVLNAENRVR